MQRRIRYIPVLRCKQAELQALLKLNKSRVDFEYLTPLIELVPSHFVCTEGTKKVRTTQVLVDLADDLLNHWGVEYPFFLDLWHLPENLTCENGNHPLMAIGQHLKIRGLLPIPVIGLDEKRTLEYKTSVCSMISSLKNGVCIRLLVKDFQQMNFQNRLAQLLKDLEVTPQQSDIIIDYQLIDEHNDKVPPFEALFTKLPLLSGWHSLTVIGGSFPPDMQGLKPNKTHLLPRLEWKYWLDQVDGLRYQTRMPDYGDYTIQHPILTEKTFRGSANIRYASDGYWIVMKGQKLTQRTGSRQYLALASLLCERDEYRGQEFSEGDRYIYEKSLELERPEGKEATGNPATWLQAGINHHIVFVMNQLAQLTSP